MADRNKLTALVLEFGGVENAAEILGIDSDLLENAINGVRLSRIDNADIDIAYANLEKNMALGEKEILDNIDEIVKDSGLSAEIQERIDYLGIDAVRNELENQEGLFEDLTAKEHKLLTKLFDADTNEFDIEKIESLADELQNASFLAADPALYDGLLQAIARGQVEEKHISEFQYLFADSYLNNGRREIILEWLTDNENRNAEEFMQHYRELNYDAGGDFEDSEFWEWFRGTFYNE